MTPQQLKGSILNMAVQGRLISSSENENTNELYNHLIEEKNALIKAGKCKKSKTLSPIIEDKIPFEIPDTWKWIKIGEIASLVTKGTTPRSGNIAYLDSGIGFLRAENVAGLDKLNKDNLKYIDEETHTGYLKRSIIEEKDILITIAGTLGRTGIVRKEDLPLNANQAVSIIRLVAPEMLNLKYLVYAINSPEIQKYLTQQKKITAIPNLTLEIIENCLIPLAPLSAQNAVVTKIEELMPFVDRYSASYEKLGQFNAKFPEEMKKSILQYAIQGKLVEQRAEEGNAEDLYQQIQEEKQKLIKEGKIKKEKPLAEITEDEIPFDIPDSWKWCYIGELFLHNTGKAQNSSGSTNGTIRKFITTSNLYWNEFDFTKVKEMPFTDKELERCTVQKGDLLVCEGGDCGRSAVWNFDEEVCIQNHVHRLRPYKELDIYYFYYLFYFYKNTGKLRGRGVAIQGLSNEAIHNVIVPLPPLEEQHRIVAKIEELLPYCNQLIK